MQQSKSCLDVKERGPANRTRSGAGGIRTLSLALKRRLLSLVSYDPAKSGIRLVLVLVLVLLRDALTTTMDVSISSVQASLHSPPLQLLLASRRSRRAAR